MDVRTIDARQRTLLPRFNLVWKSRELVWLFVKRHLTGRYRQMALGAGWAVIEPIIQLGLMSVVFGLILHVNSNGYPYPIYVFAALLPWQHFSRTTLSVAGSLQDNLGLIAKVYFPRLVLPIAAAIRELVDTGVQLIILLIVSAFWGFLPSLGALLLFPFVLVAVSIAATGVGLWLAALMVRFRDVRPALGIVLQAGMYLSPVVYSASAIPEKYQFLYQLNPMYWPIETFRWLLLGQPLHLSPSLPAALALVLAVVASGAIVFTVYERTTVDVL